MARRKELKSIASGILGSFISRNNDISGYWGMGLLRKLADDKGETKVQIDLLSPSITLDSPQAVELTKMYSDMLSGLLDKRSIPSSWVKSATIVINFSPEQPSIFIPICTWGYLFQVSIQIADDRGKNMEVLNYGYCGPHDPARESRSSRAEHDQQRH